MKRFVFGQFAFSAVIIGVIAALMFMSHGVVGAVLYLAFAALCMTPAVCQYNLLKRKLRQKNKSSRPFGETVVHKFTEKGDTK